MKLYLWLAWKLWGIFIHPTHASSNALATREAEFRFCDNSALFWLFFGEFSAKILPQYPKKGFFLLEFLPNVAKYLANNPMESEDLPKIGKKVKKIPKYAEFRIFP